MITHLGIHENLKILLWPKCTSAKNKLENIMVNPLKEKCDYEKFHGNMLDYTKYLQNFG